MEMVMVAGVAFTTEGILAATSVSSALLTVSSTALFKSLPSPSFSSPAMVRRKTSFSQVSPWPPRLYRGSRKAKDPGAMLSSLLASISSPISSDIAAPGSSSPLLSSFSSPASLLLLDRAMEYIQQRQPQKAFDALSEAYAYDPSTPGLQIAFESCLRLKIELAGQDSGASSSIDALRDRLGLASILLDEGRYEEAAEQLRVIVLPLTHYLEKTSPSGSISADVVNDAMFRKAQRDLFDKALSMLYQSDASACRWDDWEKCGKMIALSLHQCFEEDESNSTNTSPLPSLEPFDALKYPCVSLADSSRVASLYSLRAFKNVLWNGLGRTKMMTMTHADSLNGANKYDHLASSLNPQPPIVVHREIVSRRKIHWKKRAGKKVDDVLIRLGYISSDFTGKDTIAFLMQDVFHRHDPLKFRVHLYSLTPDDGSNEAAMIKSGADHWTLLSPAQTSYEMAQTIAGDRLDILVDLCGHGGVSTISEIMACRTAAPIQISCMGFSGSSGSSILHDYLICDQTVIPPTPFSLAAATTSNNSILRWYYPENLLVMPHSYFVNSHEVATNSSLMTTKQRSQIRLLNNLPSEAFVFCCHNRPDKIDPTTFRSWMKALSTVRVMGRKRGVQHEHQAVLWLLKTGTEMEHNLRRIAREEFHLEENALVFCSVAPRNDHMIRLCAADLFLDTPAYNAHSLGCDALYAGVPMLSLLRPDDNDFNFPSEGPLEEEAGPIIPTEKWANRVGASLIRALASGLENDFVVPNMTIYIQTMIRCAQDRPWFCAQRDKLQTAVRGGTGGNEPDMENKRRCPLFDTDRWVRNFELGLEEAFFLAARNEKKESTPGVLNAALRGGRRDIVVTDNDEIDWEEKIMEKDDQGKRL